MLLYDPVHLFFLCRLKINHAKELRHLSSFLGLLAWSRTINLLVLHFTEG
jgi:hypothetical protein